MVAGLLDETAASISADDEIGDRLRQAAVDLAALQADVDGEDAGDMGERIVASICGLYSMEQEREVHAPVIGSPSPATSLDAAARPRAAPAAADGGLDAIFF